MTLQEITNIAQGVVLSAVIFLIAWGIVAAVEDLIKFLDYHWPRNYVRVEHDGSYLICRPEEVWAYLPDDPEELKEYRTTPVRMSRASFDRLPEFDGF